MEKAQKKLKYNNSPVIDEIRAIQYIAKSQAAYQSGRSTTEHVFAIKLLAEMAITSKDLTIYLLMLDMSKAFYTINLCHFPEFTIIFTPLLPTITLDFPVFTFNPLSRRLALHSATRLPSCSIVGAIVLGHQHTSTRKEHHTRLTGDNIHDSSKQQYWPLMQTNLHFKREYWKRGSDVRCQFITCSLDSSLERELLMPSCDKYKINTEKRRSCTKRIQPARVWCATVPQSGGLFGGTLCKL